MFVCGGSGLTETRQRTVEDSRDGRCALVILAKAIEPTMEALRRDDERKELKKVAAVASQPD